MRRIKQILCAICLTGVMILGLIGISPIKTVDAASGPYIIMTGGYVYKNGSMQSTNSHISYNKSTNTLTINNLTAGLNGKSNPSLTARSMGNLKIKLIGTNKMKSISMASSSGVTFTGSGKLILRNTGEYGYGIHVDGPSSAKITIEKNSKLDIKVNSGRPAMEVTQSNGTNGKPLVIKSGNKHSSGKMNRDNPSAGTRYRWSKNTFTCKGSSKTNTSKTIPFNKTIKNKWLFGEYKKAHLKYNGKNFTMTGKWSTAKTIDGALSGAQKGKSLRYYKAGTLKTGYYAGSIIYDSKSTVKKNQELVLNLLLVHVDKNGKIDKILRTD